MRSSSAGASPTSAPCACWSSPARGTSRRAFRACAAWSRQDPSTSGLAPPTRGEIDGGQGRNRTTDTRIFSPLLYQLSYLAVPGAPDDSGAFEEGRIIRANRDRMKPPPPRQAGKKKGAPKRPFFACDSRTTRITCPCRPCRPYPACRGRVRHPSSPRPARPPSRRW